MNRSFQEEDKYLQKKRHKELPQEILEEGVELQKKWNSAGSQKEKQIQFFIANIDPIHEKEIQQEDKKLSGEDLKIKSRREKAFEIINSAKKGKDELKYLKDSLKYDNTKKYTIYRLLKYYYENNDKEKYNESIKNFKLCITKKFKVNEGNKELSVDLNKFLDSREVIDEYEEHPKYCIVEKNPNDLRDKLVYLFTDYFYIAQTMVEVIKLLPEQELNEIITFKYESSPKNKFIKAFNFEKGRESKLAILKKIFPLKKNNLSINNPEELIQIMENFLCRYFYVKEFDYLKINQVISYENNLTLYYNYIIYLFYEIVIEVNKDENQIIYKTTKIKKYNNLTNFHNILFDKFLDSKIKFNETCNQLLQFLLFALSSEWTENLYIDSESLHFEKFDKFLTLKKANQLIKKLKDKFIDLDVEIDKENIIFEKNEDLKIELKFRNYSEKILKNRVGMNIFWSNISFEKFQTTNFFLEADLNYLKYLIKKILSSNLIKSIFEKFSNVSTVTDYYFNEEDNIDDYINRIIFLPFKVADMGKYAKTDRLLLSVLVSGYPEKEIIDINEYRIFRILELALRIIILSLLEPSHFIKSVYSILTEGKISRFTQKDNADIDSGSFLEEIFFTWKANENNPLDLSQFNLDDKIEYKNKVFLEKKIDLITALTLLNPDIYSKDLNYFRKCIFEITKEDLKTFSVSSDNLDPIYKKYLQSVITDDIIRNSSKSRYYINASRKCGIDYYYIDYITTNHNSSI